MSFFEYGELQAQLPEGMVPRTTQCAHIFPEFMSVGIDNPIKVSISTLCCYFIKLTLSQERLRCERMDYH